MDLSALFVPSPNAVGQPVLSWVKLGVFSLFVSLQLLKNLALLLLGEFLSVNASVLAHDSGKSLSVLNFLNCFLLRRRLFLKLGWLNVVFGWREVKFYVGLDAANLIVGLRLQNIDGVFHSTELNVNRVSLVKDGVIG